MLGPVIRAVVGDTIMVTFKNLLPPSSGFNVSMHPHGMLYDKGSEGSPYADGLPRKWLWFQLCVIMHARARAHSCNAAAHAHHN